MDYSNQTFRTPDSGASQAQAAAANLEAAAESCDQAFFAAKQAGAAGWESPAANLFRNWLTVLASDISRHATEVATQKRAVSNL